MPWRRLSTTHPNRWLFEEEEDYRRFLDEKAQTIRLFEGLGKALSTREIEILAEDEKRTCVECNHFGAGRHFFYCLWAYSPHRGRMEPDNRPCKWFASGKEAR